MDVLLSKFMSHEVIKFQTLKNNLLKALNCFKVNSLITGQTPQGDNTKPIKKSTDIKKRDNLSGKNSKGGGHIYSYVREE